MGYILLGIMYICLGIYMVVLMMNVVRKCRKTHSEYYKREIPLKIACLLLLVVDLRYCVFKPQSYPYDDYGNQHMVLRDFEHIFCTHVRSSLQKTLVVVSRYEI